LAAALTCNRLNQDKCLNDALKEACGCYEHGSDSFYCSLLNKKYDLVFLLKELSINPEGRVSDEIDYNIRFYADFVLHYKTIVKIVDKLHIVPNYINLTELMGILRDFLIAHPLPSSPPDMISIGLPSLFRKKKQKKPSEETAGQTRERMDREETNITYKELFGLLNHILLFGQGLHHFLVKNNEKNKTNSKIWPFRSGLEYVLSKTNGLIKKEISKYGFKLLNLDSKSRMNTPCDVSQVKQTCCSLSSVLACRSDSLSIWCFMNRSEGNGLRLLLQACSLEESLSPFVNNSIIDFLTSGTFVTGPGPAKQYTDVELLHIDYQKGTREGPDMFYDPGWYPLIVGLMLNLSTYSGVILTTETQHYLKKVYDTWKWSNLAIIAEIKDETLKKNVEAYHEENYPIPLKEKDTFGKKIIKKIVDPRASFEKIIKEVIVNPKPLFDKLIILTKNLDTFIQGNNIINHIREYANIQWADIIGFVKLFVDIINILLDLLPDIQKYFKTIKFRLLNYIPGVRQKITKIFTLVKYFTHVIQIQLSKHELSFPLVAKLERAVNKIVMLPALKIN
jgi:hypothetical protein